MAATASGLPSLTAMQDKPAKWHQTMSLLDTEVLLSLLGGWTVLHMGLGLSTVTDPLMLSVGINTPKPLHLVLPSF